MINEIISYLDYTIPAGSDPGPLVDLGDLRVVGWICPAAMDGGSFLIHGGVDGVNNLRLNQQGNVIQVSTVVNKIYIPTDNNINEALYCLRWFSLDSNLTETSDITVRLILRGRTS